MAATQKTGAVFRSNAEKIFLIFFFPAVFFGYLFYKYPGLLVNRLIDNPKNLYFLGKSPSFWYMLIYTAIVCFIAASVLWHNSNPYNVSKKKLPLNSYQKMKWCSILLCQFFAYLFFPFILPGLRQDGGFFADPLKPVYKDAIVYVYKGFFSAGSFFFIFVALPFIVWFFGKRFCSWFCACGNLAEAIGVTTWGARWVQNLTPRGEKANKLEVLQNIFLYFALFFGLMLFIDTWKLFTVGNLPALLRQFQYVVVDLLFGSIIGVGAYPLLGTRIWCRYGCPLAKGMELSGRYSHSKFRVMANSNCKGINLCSQACPMGIDVASFAHKEKKAIEGSFGLDKTLCIGCGSCISICPVKALEFKIMLAGEKRTGGK
ncbi:4Fe-4S binding protein [Candidatus Riflebacteria bacterium]